jgi:hypothetical protein
MLQAGCFQMDGERDGDSNLGSPTFGRISENKATTRLLSKGGEPRRLDKARMAISVKLVYRTCAARPAPGAAKKSSPD